MTGIELRRHRRRLKLTQRELADRLGVHVNSLARQERGELGIRESQARLLRMLVAQSTKGKGR